MAYYINFSWNRYVYDPLVLGKRLAIFEVFLMKMTIIKRRANLSLVSCLLIAASVNQSVDAQSLLDWQSHDEIRSRAVQFLSELPGVDGDAKIKVNTLDARIKLPVCDELSFFFPSGSRQQGNVRLGARCMSPEVWSIYLDASVINPSVDAYTGADGKIIYKLSALGGRQVTSGKSTDRSGHQVLNSARVEPAIVRGQTVKVIAKRNGFIISYEGKSLSTAMAGDIVQVRTISKRTITGVAQANGIIDIISN